MQSELMGIFKIKKKGKRETIFTILEAVLFSDNIGLENMNCL